MTTDSLTQRIREAHAARRALRVAGAGTWLDAGRPVRAAATVSLAGDHGIVEYVPGDLTLTARAGTPLAAIDAATRANGQWLTLDPWGGDDGTLGATLSTSSAGPHAHAMGLPRDVVLGLEFVTGTGTVVRSGGRVVKNVAGFDLTRLLIGSWGTLGIITEATVRLRARPEHTRSVAIPVRSAPPALNELATTLRALPFSPLASEVVNPAFAERLGLGDAPLLLLRVGGNAKAVAAQLDALGPLGVSRDVDETIWPALRSAAASHSPTGHAPTGSWRWSQPPAAFGDTWGAADRATRILGATLLHGSPARGVVRVVAPAAPNATDAELARTASAFAGTVVIESLPETAWAHLPAPAPDPVSRAIRGKFDPAGILNAGIMGVDA